MKTSILAAAALLGSTALAQAGAIDRSGQSITALFEKGRYAEFSFASISPDTSGVGTPFSGTPGAATGDITPSYLQFGAAYKADLNDQLSYAIIYDQPYGADVSYPASGYALAGTQAEFSSHGLTGLLRYKMPSNFSVHGGIRVQTIDTSIAIPARGYAAVGDGDTALGYVLGVAYEKPEIALRVSLTYNSKIKHDVATLENRALASITEVETPQSVNLEFQTGVAKDTLVFGGVRWTDFSAFDITPVGYATANGGASLLSYSDDVYTWTLGVGRKLSDTWAVSASVGYEKSNGGFASNLGPTDGNKSLALAAVYTKDNMKITSGIRYVNIGDAQSSFDGVNAASNFDDNHAVAIGVKIGYTF